MAQAAAIEPLVLGRADTSRLGGLRWLSPVLVGLSLPFVATLVLFPVLLAHVWIPVVTLLMLMVVMSIVAYSASVLLQGDITGLVIDRAGKTITLVQEGPFATRTTPLPLSEIADLQQSVAYDRDGYCEQTVNLRLKDGTSLPLPRTLSPTELAAARQALSRS